MRKDTRYLLPILAFAVVAAYLWAEAASQAGRRVEFALVVHGGAGVIPKTMPQERQQEYVETLRRALAHGRDRLAAGAAAVEVVEEVIRILEDSPLFNAGKGAVFTHEGTHELDAAIMDGSTLSCGAVTGLRTIKNPITLARRVMEESPHVFLAGAGAEQFAAEMGLGQVDAKYFFVQRRYDQWQAALEEEKKAAEEPPDPPRDDGKHGTVGVVALDHAGHLAAGTSTGGLTNKRFGRIGDVPVIGAGTYANHRVAISCTGKGEEFIRNTVARDVAALVEYRGLSVQEAAETVVGEKLQPGDGGLIAVAHNGAIAMVFNSKGMFRAAADSSGRFEVKIWE